MKKVFDFVALLNQKNCLLVQYAHHIFLFDCSIFFQDIFCYLSHIFCYFYGEYDYDYIVLSVSLNCDGNIVAIGSNGN